MVDIFHCFFCEKHLGNDRSEELDEAYFFWCDKTCHDNYNKKVEESGRVLREWSAFMCKEGPCPKEMKHFLVVPKEEPIDPPKKKKAHKEKAASKQEIGGRKKCGKCGQPGHNARTCGKQPSTAIVSNKSIPKPRKMSQRKQYICGKCGKLGHNARTCGKK